MQTPHDFTATIHDGIVTQVDDATHSVRCAIPALENMETDWLIVLVQNACADQDYDLPDEGTLVKCLLDARGESGCVIGAVYTAQDKPPVANKNIWMKHFANGTVIQHDRSTGNVTIETSGNVLIKAGGKVTIDCPETETTGNLLVKGSLTYQGGMTGSGGSGAAAKINGSLQATGDVKAGNISLGTHDHQSGVGQPT